MANLIILGSSNAIPSLNHENTHLAITSAERTVLIDCVSNPVVRLEQAGVDVSTVTEYYPDPFPS
jgi:ribonuclease BN (tRNA processing enzyme)